MYKAEGQIFIPLEEFWEFVQKYHDLKSCNVIYGVPRIEEQDIVIDYAASSDCDPNDWFVKPKAALQWIELKAKGEIK